MKPVLTCLVGVPRCFVRIYFIVARIWGGLVANIGEDEELRFWTEVGSVGNAGGL
jgi:hypothetical protein